MESCAEAGVLVRAQAAEHSMSAPAAPAEVAERWASNACSSTSSTTETASASKSPNLLRRLSSTKDTFSKGLRTLTRELFGNNLEHKGRHGNRAQRTCSGSPDSYKFIEVLGHGASATVVRAKCLSTRQVVAVKQIEVDALPVDWSTFVSEAQVMRGLKHKHLLPLLNTVLDGDHLWLVTPFVKGGTMSDILCHAYSGSGLPEPVLATVAGAVLQALAYLHGQGYVHRDVKASNVLLDSDGTVYLGDLGTVAHVRTRDERRPEVMLRLERTTFIGTLPYMSPEVVEGVAYGEATDVWSLGVMLVELATGQRPHKGRNTAQTLYAVMNDDPIQLPEGGKFSPAMRDLVAKCLVKDPAQRCTAKKLLSHPVIKKLARGEAYLKAEVMPRLPPSKERARVYSSTSEGQPYMGYGEQQPRHGMANAPLTPSAEAEVAACAAHGGVLARGPMPQRSMSLASMRSCGSANGMRRYSSASMRSAGGSNGLLNSAQFGSFGSLHEHDVMCTQDDDDGWDFSPAYAT